MVAGRAVRSPPDLCARPPRACNAGSGRLRRRLHIAGLERLGLALDLRRRHRPQHKALFEPAPDLFGDQQVHLEVAGQAFDATLIGSPVALHFDNPPAPITPATTSPPWMPMPKRDCGSLCEPDEQSDLEFSAILSKRNCH